MSALTLKVALELTAQALSVGRQISAAPLTVVVLDSGGHLLALQREDGASLLRPSIAIGKAWWQKRLATAKQDASCMARRLWPTHSHILYIC